MSILDDAMRRKSVLYYWWEIPIKIFLCFIAIGSGLGAATKIMIWIIRL